MVRLQDFQLTLVTQWQLEFLLEKKHDVKMLLEFLEFAELPPFCCRKLRLVDVRCEIDGQ